jgi:hypothetical protein
MATLPRKLGERLAAALNGGPEPLWREVAYWGVLLCFFALPIVALILHLSILFGRVRYQEHAGEFNYLWSFHRILAGLLAAMLGLNSWDKHTQANGRRGSGDHPEVTSRGH